MSLTKRGIEQQKEKYRPGMQSPEGRVPGASNG